MNETNVVALVLKTKAQPKQRPKQSSHNKTIKTEQTLKKGGDKSPSGVTLSTIDKDTHNTQKEIIV